MVLNGRRQLKRVYMKKFVIIAKNVRGSVSDRRRPPPGAQLSQQTPPLEKDGKFSTFHDRDPSKTDDV
jgi:hypothetical protein